MHERMLREGALPQPVAMVRALKQHAKLPSSRKDTPVTLAEQSLAERIHTVLERSAFFDGRKIKLVVQDGRVVVSGVLPSYYQKQMIQQHLADIPGVREIHDELEIMAVA